MNDPSTKAAYEAKAQGSGQLSAYNIAVTDFFNTPDIEEADMSGYTGARNAVVHPKSIKIKIFFLTRFD